MSSLSNPPINFLGDLQRLDVKPGDIFVLSTDMILSEENRQVLKTIVEDALGGAPVLVLSEGMKLGVIRQEDAA